MENRTMTAEELRGYDTSVFGFVFDTDDYESRLYVAPQVEGDGFLLYGDLREAFDVDDSYMPDEHGDFGNYIVERIVRKALGDHPLGRHIEVEFDPEGATFFAYTKDRVHAVTLATFIADLVAERRKAVNT